MANKKLENAFHRGVLAFRQGRFSSPYKPGTLLEKEFMRGFDRAYLDNQRG